MNREIIKILEYLIDSDSFGLYTEVDISEREPSIAFQGDQLDENLKFLRFCNYKNTGKASEYLLNWQKQDRLNNNRWNKLNLTISKDGTFEYKTWWDEQFYQDVYGEPSGFA